MAWHVLVSVGNTNFKRTFGRKTITFKYLQWRWKNKTKKTIKWMISCSGSNVYIVENPCRLPSRSHASDGGVANAKQCKQCHFQRRVLQHGTTIFDRLHMSCVVPLLLWGLTDGWVGGVIQKKKCTTLLMSRILVSEQLKKKKRLLHPKM